MVAPFAAYFRAGLVAVAGTLAATLAACGAEQETATNGDINPASGANPPLATTSTERVALKRVRLANPDAGRALFVEKGCVICHSANGVGGKAAPALDAPIGAPAVDPLDFAARMWRGAPAMIELQSVELGYTIHLTAAEIADLAAFATDMDAQKMLTQDHLPKTIQNGLLDRRFWEIDDGLDALRARFDDEIRPYDGVEIPLEAEELPVDPD